MLQKISPVHSHYFKGRKILKDIIRQGCELVDLQNAFHMLQFQEQSTGGTEDT